VVGALAGRHRLARFRTLIAPVVNLSTSVVKLTIVNRNGYNVTVGLKVSAFATLASTTRQAIYKAIDGQRLIQSPDGTLDPSNVVNATFIAQHRGHVGRVAPAQSPEDRAFQKSIRTRPELKIVKASKGDTVSPPADKDPLSAALAAGAKDANLDIQKKKSEIKVLHDRHDSYQLAIAIKKNEMIHRDQIRRRYAALDVALKTNIKDLARRSSARLYAIALSEGQAALESALEQECSEALRRIVAEATEQHLEG
jgi:hypothetical protein